MAGGIYAALSGLQLRTDRLDRLAADISNVGAPGYKAERSGNIAVARPSFSDVLDSVVDVVAAPSGSNFRNGEVNPTGRDLDLAIEGEGFFALQTPAGVRYTRNGSFSRASDGTLTAKDGSPVLGDRGPIKLGEGTLSIDADGTVKTGGEELGRIQVFTFAEPSKLVREDGIRFAAPSDVEANPLQGASVRKGMLEQSNVSLPERMGQMIELTRSFEALQRGLSVLINDIDGRAITELGRR